MDNIIKISDDGDEVVFFWLGDKVIGEACHEDYGWAGMKDVIKLVTDLAIALGAEVDNTQDIV